ncbi:DUF4867 family protein [Leadbettera azotonutricia]|uniref:DUF4867 domain-containing protein n=1 Tax=Leadbettera azotonutricia (strain ATCC BAA-888 / DSM 13862 / ZAS-9) TaxID=545695 RepID=F5Y9V4_LEAAZ|nr:DUF4867 family protein [Leadbettera azotonutricia]AEF80611.1 conserved hypothetical protein [Leadbettera azotonutricia ZAS-9]
MHVKPVSDKSFKPYGYVVEGYDFSKLLKTLEETTEKPNEGTIYVPSDPKLEALPIFAELQDRAFGGIPVQIGYCNGFNTKLNCLEYHRGSEICVAADDIIMLLAKLQDVEGGKIDTSRVEAFLLPKGTGILYYETSMHYAPAKAKAPFRSIIVLPRQTNTDLPNFTAKNAEDKLLRARNKWLIAHADAPEAKSGAVVGVTGKNIDVERDLK